MPHFVHFRRLLAVLLLSGGAILLAFLIIGGSGSISVIRPAKSAADLDNFFPEKTERFSDSTVAAVDGVAAQLVEDRVDEVSGKPGVTSPGDAVEETRYTFSGSSHSAGNGEGVMGQSSVDLEIGSVSAPAFIPETSFSNDHQWIANDPTVPGSRLSHEGQTARVTAVQPVSGSNGAALAIVVEDSYVTSLPVADPSLVLEKEPADAIEFSPSGMIARRGGFTHEEELFRTKWGWAAYDQVRRILRKETSD